MKTNVSARSEIIGLDDLQKAFLAIPENSKREIKRKIDMMSYRILEDAKSNIRKNNKRTSLNPGGLLESVSVENAKEKKPFTIQGLVYTRAPHAAKVELGHKLKSNKKLVGRVKPYPFLKPAADKNKRSYVSNVIDALNNALEKFGGKI